MIVVLLQQRGYCGLEHDLGREGDRKQQNYDHFSRWLRSRGVGGPFLGPWLARPWHS